MNFGVKIMGLVILFLFANNVYAQQNDKQTFTLTTLKKSNFKNSFRDVKTGRKFIIYKVQLINTDSINHRIDYSCFKLIDANNNKYPVHQYASIIKQTEFQDLSPRKDVDNYGFNNKIIQSKFSVTGWLVFEVPSVQDYILEFQGYIK